MENTKSYMVKLPESLHRDLKMLAAAEGKTIGALLVEAVRCYVEASQRPAMVRTFSDERLAAWLAEDARETNADPELIEWARQKLAGKGKA